MEGSTLAIRIRGPEALFCIPHFRADPHTWPCPTPSAVERIFSSIYCKPEFIWEPTKILVMSPIRYSSTQRKAMIDSAQPIPTKRRTLQTVTSLVDVEYILEARLVVNPYRAARSTHSYWKEAQRRMRQGNQFRQPFLGWREFIGHWEIHEGALPQAQPIDQDLGSMLLDQVAIDASKDLWQPIFFRAQLKQGVLEIPEQIYADLRDYKMKTRHAYASRQKDPVFPEIPDIATQARTGPARVFLDALIDRGNVMGVPDGCESKSVKWVLTIGADGSFKSIEKRKGLIPVPKMGRTIQIQANTAIDNFIYALGAGGVGRRTIYATERHQAFLTTLTEIDHPAAKIVHTFLTNPSRPVIVPLTTTLTDEAMDEFNQHKAVPHIFLKHLTKAPGALFSRKKLTVNQTFIESYQCIVEGAEASHPNDTMATEHIYVPAIPGDRLLIEVEGYPEWWLSEPVLDLHRKRLSKINSGVSKTKKKGNVRTGICSICGDRDVLTRLFPASKLGALISFNASAWEGYGRYGKGKGQGYNAPTCTSCASSIARGLDNIANNKECCKRLGNDLYMLWWPEDPKAQNPMPLFDTAIDKEASPAERTEALNQIPNGHVVFVERFMQRLNLRRYTYATSESVIQNVQKWTQAFESMDFEEPQKPWTLATVLFNRIGGKPEGKVFERHLETLYLNLLCSEQIPARSIQPLRRKYFDDLINRGSRTNRRRAALLQYAEIDTTEEPMTEKEAFAYYLGRAFARADWIQKGSSQPQRSLRFTHFPAAKHDPGVAIQCIDKYAVHRPRRRGDKASTDKEANTFRLQAHEALNGTDSPHRFTRRETTQFSFGFVEQEALHWKRIAERKAKKDNPTDTDTDTNTETPTQAQGEGQPNA